MTNINNLNPGDRLEAIARMPRDIAKIDCPTEAEQLIAIRFTNSTIQYITKPTLKVQREVVSVRGWLIKFIHEPCEEVQMLAVENDYNSILNINHPTFETGLLAVRRGWRITENENGKFSDEDYQFLMAVACQF